MDDWNNKFHKKYYLFIDFQNALFVPYGNNGLVTILVPIFGK
jgi:hypothetical protein